MTEVNVEDFEMPGKVYGEYTPTEYVTFSPDPANTCSHTLNIRINAPVAECYQFISTWDNLAHCCDLIDIVRPPCPACRTLVEHTLGISTVDQDIHA